LSQAGSRQWAGRPPSRIGIVLRPAVAYITGVRVTWKRPIAGLFRVVRLDMWSTMPVRMPLDQCLELSKGKENGCSTFNANESKILHSSLLMKSKT